MASRSGIHIIVTIWQVLAESARSYTFPECSCCYCRWQTS